MTFAFSAMLIVATIDQLSKSKSKLVGGFVSLGLSFGFIEIAGCGASAA